MWTIVIDGQQNRDPIASYGPPVITNVQYAPGSGGSGSPVGANGVRTDGQVDLLVSGANFGPPPGQQPYGTLVQYVRVQSPVAVSSVLAFLVVNHTTLRVTVGPGVGTNLSFVVSVADQVSTSTPAVPGGTVTFDYLPPIVTDVSPTHGATSTAAGLLVTLSGHNLGLSAAASVDVIVGNPEDGSVSSRIPAQPVFPPGDDGSPRVRAVEQVRFAVPAGVGPARAVRVLVYPALYVELAVSSDPTSVGSSSFFSYDPPVVTSVVTALVGNDSVDAQSVLQRFGSVSGKHAAFRADAGVVSFK